MTICQIWEKSVKWPNTNFVTFCAWIAIRLFDQLFQIWWIWWMEIQWQTVAELPFSRSHSKKLKRNLGYSECTVITHHKHRRRKRLISISGVISIINNQVHLCSWFGSDNEEINRLFILLIRVFGWSCGIISLTMSTVCLQTSRYLPGNAAKYTESHLQWIGLQDADFFAPISLTAMLKSSVTTSTPYNESFLLHLFTHCKWDPGYTGFHLQ